MYQQIKQLADEALALQNKDRMDAALRDISALCNQAAGKQPEQHGDEHTSQHPAAADVAVDTTEGGVQ